MRESVFTNVATGVTAAEILRQIYIFGRPFPLYGTLRADRSRFTTGGASRCRLGGDAAACK